MDAWIKTEAPEASSQEPAKRTRRRALAPPPPPALCEIPKAQLLQKRIRKQINGQRVAQSQKEPFGGHKFLPCSIWTHTVGFLDPAASGQDCLKSFGGSCPRTATMPKDIALCGKSKFPTCFSHIHTLPHLPFNQQKLDLLPVEVWPSIEGTISVDPTGVFHGRPLKDTGILQAAFCEGKHTRILGISSNSLCFGVDKVI